MKKGKNHPVRIAKSEVKSIYNSDGAEVSTREELEQAHIDFYSDLFTAEPIDPECQAFLLSEVHNSLPDSERALCEGRGLSPAELTSSLKTPNAHKAPGPDGFIVEFYVKFWKLLGPLLSEVITKCFEEGNLCESMKSSATRLIFKKRGDIKDLKNWRPISLLNVDYKIGSKAITLRLSKVLDSILWARLPSFLARRLLLHFARWR